MKKVIEIWSEGYRATGESGTAHMHGRVLAENLEEAILIHALDNKAFFEQLSHSPSDRGSNFTYWGCRIFDNEKDARKSFG